MSEIRTTKRIHAAHLAELLPGKGVRVTDPSPGSQESRVRSDATQGELEAAVASYVYDPARVSADAAVLESLSQQQADRRDRVRTKIEQAIVIIEDATKDKATWDGLTQAQRQEVTRRANFVAAKLGRLALNKFDAAE